MSLTLGIASALEGFLGSRDRQREEKRVAEESALEGKRALGRIALEQLLAGKARPEGAIPLLRDYQASYDHRPPAPGMAGFFGDTVEPPTPNFDALLGGQTPWQGPGGLMYSPEEQYQRETDWLIGRKTLEGKMDLKAWRDSLPELIATLGQMGVSPDTARNILLAQKFGENILGVKGTPIDFWDPKRKMIFKGQRNPFMQSIVDVATNQAVDGAEAVKVDEQVAADGSVSYISMNTGQVLHKTAPGTRTPYNPPVFWMPQMGGYGLGGPNPQFVQAPGMPTQPNYGGGQPPVDPNTELLRRNWEEANQEVRAQMAILENQLGANFPGRQPEFDAKRQAIYQQMAQHYGYPSWEAFRQAHSTAVLRPPGAGMMQRSLVPQAVQPQSPTAPVIAPPPPPSNLTSGQPVTPSTPATIGTPQMNRTPTQPNLNEARSALIGGKTYLVRPMPGGQGWAASTDAGRTWTGPVTMNGQLWAPQ